ncbi:MAG: hypothetical protein COY81_03765 [Candidatus Pacebacteria bacterium CG_4_10_14_0_8_um_filter_43_12]|nr:MAG: hypothetical protein COU66_00715 [Candidatus Pacebacteria bacterium CG10_big_fil_rev_8_21_14_0_10_44_11]PIY79201.1 MAG: hypothetical protein COY81_03765 [Candidatus Pacebacteria bacterium CG_4_10_14_0_8_um_filter_43_12]
MKSPDIFGQVPAPMEVSSPESNLAEMVLLGKIIDVSQLPSSYANLSPEARRELYKKIENARLVSAAITLVKAVRPELKSAA